MALVFGQALVAARPGLAVLTDVGRVAHLGAGETDQLPTTDWGPEVPGLMFVVPVHAAAGQSKAELAEQQQRFAAAQLRDLVVVT